MEKETAPGGQSGETQGLKIGPSFTLNEIRGILSEEIEKLRKGDTTAGNVHAISNASGKILSSVKLELEAMKMLGKKPVGLTALTGSYDTTTEEKKTGE